MCPPTRWLQLLGWSVALLISLAVAEPTLGQNPLQNPANRLPPAPAPVAALAPINGDGNDVLRWILGQQRWQALPSWREAIADPAKTLLLVLGDCGWSLGRPGLEPREVEQFVSSGGALLLASDRPHRVGGARELLALGVDIAGAFVVVPRGPLYRGVPTWPLAVPIRHPAIPVFNQLNQVATNRPSFLRLRPGSPLQYLARFDPSASLEDNRRLLVDNYDGHFAAAGFVGKGKALVLADHSLFINSMLWQQDNQNLQLTLLALVWLREPAQPDQPKRTRCLMIDDGQIQPSFDVPIEALSTPTPPTTPPPLDPAELLAALLPHANQLVRPIDQLIHDAQSPPNDPIGQADRFIAERISPPQRNLLLAATVVLVMVGAFWLFNSWRRTITQPGRIEAKSTTKTWRALANVIPFLGLVFAVAVLIPSLLYGGQLIRKLGPSVYGLSVLLGISVVVGLFAWLARRPSEEISALAELADSPKRKAAESTDQPSRSLAEDNLLEPLARDLRDRFARLGADPKQRTLPPVRIELPWYKRWQIRSKLAQLWAISQCQHPSPIRPRDWTDTRALMKQLEALAANGVWRFSISQETA